MVYFDGLHRTLDFRKAYEQYLKYGKHISQFYDLDKEEKQLQEQPSDDLVQKCLDGKNIEPVDL